MKTLGVTLTVASAFFTALVACSAPAIDSGGLDTRQGSDPKLPSSNNNSGSKAPASTSNPPASTAPPSSTAPPDTSSPPPADCNTTADANACFDCCAAKNAAAAQQIETFFQDCFCGASACQTQCAQTACSATPSAPTPGDACDTCLAGREQTCDQQFQTNCANDPACTALLQCETASQCESKP